MPLLWPLVIVAGSIGRGCCGPCRQRTSPASQRSSPGSALAASLLHDGPRVPHPGAWVSSQCLCAACSLPGAPRSLLGIRPSAASRVCHWPRLSGACAPCPCACPGGLCPARQHSCGYVAEGTLAPCVCCVLGNQSALPRQAGGSVPLRRNRRIFASLSKQAEEVFSQGVCVFKFHTYRQVAHKEVSLVFSHRQLRIARFSILSR